MTAQGRLEPIGAELNNHELPFFYSVNIYLRIENQPRITDTYIR
jgi:hypothetical protein